MKRSSSVLDTTRFDVCCDSQERFRSALARESSTGEGRQLPSTKPRRMEEVLAGIAQGDAALLLGGDLTVLVLEV